MGLKDLNSTLDLVGGNDPVGNMDGQQGPQFQLPITDASQKHIDSLTEPSIYQHGNSPETLDPSNLDLNGNQGPSFDNGMSSTLHEDGLVKLYQYTYGNSYEETGPSNLDMDGGKSTNGIFDKGMDSTLQEDSLTQEYNYAYGQNPWLTTEEAGPSKLDINGLANNPSFADPGGAGFQLAKTDLHRALLTEQYNYSYGQSPWLSTGNINNGTFDLDGNTPSGYVNPETGVAY